MKSSMQEERELTQRKMLRMESSMQKMESENSVLKGQLVQLESSMQEMKSESSVLKGRLAKLENTMDELKRLSIAVAPLYLRYLLDQARINIVKLCGFNSWEDLRGSRTMAQLKTYVASCIQLPQDVINFVCEVTSYEGYKAAPTVQEDDVRNAVLQEPVGSEERRLQEDLFRFVYGKDV
ncbi:hypothetical protein AcV7_009437 [Taiwanofungus camphoratus]|nr:hypothetical protein AcV7_009437 [Antrodia cinnamomea]